jgi:hypothetical protein
MGAPHGTIAEQTLMVGKRTDNGDGMRLIVSDAAGGHVAEVSVASDCPFAKNPGELPGFVLGELTTGPGFSTVLAILDRFDRIYGTGDLEAAAVHRELDSIGLLATDDRGTRYRIHNVYLQRGGLLFCAVR